MNFLIPQENYEERAQRIESPVLSAKNIREPAFTAGTTTIRHTAPMTGFSGRSMNGKSSASIPGCRDLSPLAPPGYAGPWKERQILQGDPGRIDIAPPLPG